MTANAKLTNGGSSLFSLGYIKRYDIPKLTERLTSEGWDQLSTWDYKGHSLCLFTHA
jgi:hypothetical protein